MVFPDWTESAVSCGFGGESGSEFWDICCVEGSGGAEGDDWRDPVEGQQGEGGGCVWVVGDWDWELDWLLHTGQDCRERGQRELQTVEQGEQEGEER